ncbi:Putative multidrug export ATP-binding/permease protein SAV1866 [Lachnospira pectinoschiza]|nr:Putative multidrug export ATP-binding/permease protein SAV1866 [Lachnospira pectinoschiza]
MLKYLKKYWFFALLAPVFMIGEVSMDLLQPELMSRIIDGGVLGLNNGGVGNLNTVITIGLKMIGFVALGGICGIMSGVFANLCAQQFGNDVRKAVFKRIMEFSFEQTDKFSTGSLITRVTNDITQLQNFVMQCLRGFVRTSMLFIGGIACMVSLNMEFGIIIACALPFVAVCVVYFIAKANPKFTVLQKKLDKVNNVMQENVSGARVVKAYVKEDYETERFEKANNELVSTQLDVLLLLSYMTPIMNIILNLSVVAVIKVGGIQVSAGSATPGNVMAAITYCSQVLNAVMRMTMIFQTASRGIASKKRVMEIINCDPAIKSGTYNKETAVKGKVEFKNVSFAYPGMDNENVIENFNLVINPGETIGILGATGCGKSSLVNLIPRFYDVTKGEVLIDGVNVKDYDLQVLRDKVSIALQKPEIFSTTIAENIAWGDDSAGSEKIRQAADIAQATEFIDNRTDGMDTQVSQGGHSLSGGQKQRVAISRAVLKNSEILIFDDATSALDLKTEADLYSELSAKKYDVTRIIIAQRIASVKNADRIVVMDNGRLADVGSHSELIKTSEIYKDIYESQLKGNE